jgi:hypothetical protein
MRRALAVWAGAIATVWSCLMTGCRTQRIVGDQPPAICALPLAEHLQHTQPDALPARVWYALLFKGYGDSIPADPVDCSGEPLAWRSLPSSCAERDPQAMPMQRRRKLGSGDLIVRHADGDYWFGWAPFLRFEDGLSEGPLAIARVYRGKLEVRAVGTLRAYARQARLEVRRVGEQHLLVAEGARCDGPGCTRGTRLLWLDRQRFHARPLRSATTRACLGPAWFAQTDLQQVELANHWLRTLRRDLTLAYDGAEIVVDEHITVSDHDRAQPTLPPRPFRRAQSQLRITLEGGELLSQGRSLWATIRLEDGATSEPSEGEEGR